ncbi:amidase [Agrobacterium larrymoorei]|uniref:Indoleacetamide hydrolase n=1 Tax=Agrobacterium larrymoorei TaxID=160699 RepID=A0ABU0UI67_9HYPH|nr:amidase [Agrobacterium larrymoorei]MDQ1184548.1 aspartyl-tRNA(Asn)/glutamyl-tRNA(Gln) amidotransferase subunit A [Agrobacterium larrymoorei]
MPEVRTSTHSTTAIETSHDAAALCPASLSVADASRQIDAGLLSPVTLLEAVLARIDNLDPIIHSYLRHDRAAARQAAQAAAERAGRKRRLGPLDGIPFAVKDNIYTRGLETTAGSRVPQKHDPSINATLVSRLQAVGAVLVGKLNTWEYGTGTGAVYEDLPVPAARNPWNPAHYTGGSSSGSGASVAAGTALFAIGTDTGGSVRLPAAACGVVGFKPTFGRISRHGIMPNCWSFDTPGPITLTVEDSALVYDAIAGYDPEDPVSLDAEAEPLAGALNARASRLKVGFVRTLGADHGSMDPTILAALDEAAEALRAAGADVREIALPIPAADYRAISVPINRSESFSIHERDYLEHRDLMGRSLREKLEVGMYMRAADYLAALRQRRALVAATDSVFGEVDVMLLPMTSRAAPRVDDQAAVTDFTTGSAGSPFSLTGHPALSLPATINQEGLPVAVQLASGFRKEAVLLAAASMLQHHFNPSPRRADPAHMIALHLRQGTAQ